LYVLQKVLEEREIFDENPNENPEGIPFLSVIPSKIAKKTGMIPKPIIACL
jgi:hypothetical protein